MGDSVIPWIMAVSAFGTLASAIAAACSARFSSRSSRAAADAVETAANTAETGLILRFRDQYASNEMFAALRKLREWYDLHGGSKLAETWREKFEQRDQLALEVDSARRRVSSFFGVIIDLQDVGLLSDRLKRVLTDFDGFDLLYNVAEPLERELNPKYDQRRFDELRKLRPPKVLGQHAAPSPPRPEQRP